MRVALICPYSLTVPGGVQGQALGLARALRAAGQEVRVLGPCDGPPPEVGVIPLGDTMTTFENGSVAAIAPDFPCVLRTIRALRDEEFDVLHLHEPLVPGPTMTSVVFSSVPKVGTFHTAGHSAAYRWLRPVTRRMAKELGIRCAVSAEARDTAARALGGDYRVIYNGIEIERYAKTTSWPAADRGPSGPSEREEQGLSGPSEREEQGPSGPSEREEQGPSGPSEREEQGLREEQGAGPDEHVPTILFLSRHESRKGLDVLLEAMASLPGDVRLWVASDGPETRRLRAGVAGDDRIEWLGPIPEDEKVGRLQAADVLCAPSLHGESFGMVLLEGMAAQTPIVASDLPGYRNVARADEEALLVPPGDAPALAAALLRVLEDSSKAAALVAAGEMRATEFSMDKLAERYLELYEEAVRT